MQKFVRVLEGERELFVNTDRIGFLEVMGDGVVLVKFDEEFGLTFSGEAARTLMTALHMR